MAKIRPAAAPRLLAPLLIALILVLSVSSVLFAAPPPTPVTAEQAFLPWQATAFAALIVSFLVISMAYMIGKGFEMPMLELWAKQEIFQVAVTVVFVILLVTGVDTFSKTIAADAAKEFKHNGGSLGFADLDTSTVELNKMESGGGSAMQFAQVYTKSQITYLAAQYNQMTYYSETVGKVSTVSGYCYAMSAGGFSIMEGRYLSDTQGSLGGAVSAVSSGLTAMEGQYFLLKIFQGSMFSLLLPLGIVLRSFSYTRAAGGLLIALALGFYIVFPVAVIVEYNIFADYVAHNPSGATISVVHMPTYNKWGEVQENNFVADLVSPGFSEPLVFRTVILTVLLPTLKIFITLTFVRWFAVIMGADVDVSSLVRMG
ncbi:Uncharacterised protein [Candidatus Gugararchaeum adminiculabundum]|nr:Uncharacterised protein [Candidatus Gugararchaeum adminiculabundum]